MINVTKTYLPPLEEYLPYLQRIWETANITNRGEFVQKLERQLQSYLGVNHLLCVANGTLALQIAIRALDLHGEIITTPFSYVATTNAILWEHCQPVFVDIEPQTYCINPEKIESAITANTSAILAVHVYGYPCQVEKIEQIAKQYHLKVIYDAAHAFGVKYNGTSILNYGDISILSFHATKLFHTVEGGAVITNNAELAQKLDLYHRFGHTYDDYYSIGINAKLSEVHAAMGLCVLPQVDAIIGRRRELIACYDSCLADMPLQRPVLQKNVAYNGAYYPVIFSSEETMLMIKEQLMQHHVNTRRYFYPSLNTLPHLPASAPCPISEDLARRVLCLPLSFELTETEIVRFCNVMCME